MKIDFVSPEKMVGVNKNIASDSFLARTCSMRQHSCFEALVKSLWKGWFMQTCVGVLYAHNAFGRFGSSGTVVIG